MCGIAGVLHCGRSAPGYDLQDQAQQMAEKIRHRGPDDAGVWADRNSGVALSHRRLAILDLSAEGHQPMVSASKRFVLVFNGEIYNYRDVKRELEDAGHVSYWRGHSDTEVLLAAVSAWGVEGAITRCTGMFALALWDRSEQALYLVRDRVGEKPLYYGWVDDSFVFASELHALRGHSRWAGQIDRNAVALFLRYGCVPAPNSIYVGIHKLRAGHVLRLTRAQGVELIGVLPESSAYWSARQIAHRGMAQSFRGTEDEARDELERLLKRSVLEQMVSDVPLGAFLSGGVDSSTVVALMQAQSTQPVKTFTIGFHEKNFNEARYAKLVAEQLGTDHTELYISPERALDVIPKLPEIYDEPFADSSQSPTFLVAGLARSRVTVSLSGDGADEVFGGYNRYFLGKRIWDGICRIPLPVRRQLSRFVRGMPLSTLELAMKVASPLLPQHIAQTASADRILKFAAILDSRTPSEMYSRLVSHWRNSGSVVRGVAPGCSLEWMDARNTIESDDMVIQMMFADLLTYLPDDILVKVDRAAMAVSLETRIPFLDHRLLEFAWTLPATMKVRNQQGKWLLRQVLYKYVPRELIERPKTGFGVPIGLWLRGPLRAWAEELLDAGRLASQGFFDPAPIIAKWHEHLSGRRNWQYHLWDVLMFQSWLQNQSKRV